LEHQYVREILVDHSLDPGRHKLKILQVIHGYPMRYNAGSEVYTQTLSHCLASRHEVHIFTREEDPFAPDFQLRRELRQEDARVTLHLVNNPRHRDRYRLVEMDRCFGEVLDEVGPDIVHIGHLNHLSTSLLLEAKARAIPIIYTLHDYWVMCPRGQFMQMLPEDPGDLWAACDGQNDRKCAERCYARYFAGAPSQMEEDTLFWSDWVRRRMEHLREMAELVALFVAPSKYLLGRYRDDFGLPEDRLVYLDYGFDRDRLRGRVRTPNEPFTFGYIGTHIPAKGIHHLIQALGQLRGPARLRIWGRPRGQETESLKALARELPEGRGEQVEWCPEYRNQDIVPEVFDRVDAIVVPSIWPENSPLVIHEAQQVRVPVITANFGGMAEYVHHEVNGLLYEFRNPQALAREMQRLLDTPGFAKELGQRGYLYDPAGNIPAIEAHTQEIERLYMQIKNKGGSPVSQDQQGPWRITFDTNPDTCNLRCVMCEEHSPHSSLQAVRMQENRPRRQMPIELLRRVVQQGAEMGLREIIPSTMGEPLLYEHFEEVIRLCVEHDLSLNLTTNGTFPRIGARAWAERLVPVASDIKVSINGATKATQESIMLGSRWEELLDNTRTLIRVRDDHEAEAGHRCRVTFQLTFQEANLKEIPDLIRLAIKLGVDRVKGHHLWSHFKEIEDQSLRRSSEAIRRWNKAVKSAREVAATYPLESGKRILLENIFPLSEASVEDIAPGGACPFLRHEAWVSAEGRFSPCCAPDEQRKALGNFGNLKDRSLRDIWTGEAYQDLASSYQDQPLCRACNMRRPVEKKS
jgi:glycosyltransferase involved in cell wall biosynthesis/MoaA/NifB/PqqE/SkfB family radical SAM enzyme